MNKKILDGTVTLLFCMSLIATSNIQERDAGEPLPDRKGYSEEQSTADWNNAVTAGVSRVLSENSFTTESDEKTDIKKKQVILVTSPAWVLDEGITREKPESEEKPAEGKEQIVPAGLAQPETANEKAEIMAAGPVEPIESKAEITAPGFAESVDARTEIAAAWSAGPRTGAAETMPSGMSSSIKDVVSAKGELAVALAEEAREAARAAQEVPVESNRWGILLTEQEIDLLARIVWLEANGEPVEGQEAVVEVVFNRIASELYPDTLYDVLSQKNPVQFCSWKNREIAKPTEKEYQSIEQVLNGNTSILRNDTLYFSTKALTPRLDKRIGGHSFCY